VPVVALFAWLLVPRTPLGLDGWRWVVLLGAAGAILVWWIRLRLPESPRWVAQKTQRGSFSEMWRPPYRTRSVMLIVFHLFQTVGFYGFANWVPTLLIKRGIAITSSLRYTFIIAIAAPLGPLLAAAIADKLERKWQIVFSAFAIAVAGILFGQMTTAALLIFFGVLLTLGNNILSFSSHAYQAELYPTRIRARAVGFVYSWSRISVVFSSFVIGFVLDRFGVPGVFTLIAGSMLIVMLAIGLLGPRTNNQALETISQ
jgi:MFS transporter, putative metabolite:H+ symporter